MLQVQRLAERKLLLIVVLKRSALVMCLMTLGVAAAAPQGSTDSAAQALGLKLAEDGTVRVSLHEIDLRLVLRAFAEVGGYQLVLDEEVRGKVTAEFDGLPPYRALVAVLRTHGLAAEIDGRFWSGEKAPPPGQSRNSRRSLTVRPIAPR